MIRNLLYSLSLHILIILVIYLNFNFQEFVEIKSDQPITISFVSIKEEKIPVIISKKAKDKTIKSKIIQKKKSKKIKKKKITKIIKKPKLEKKDKKKKSRIVKKELKKAQEREVKNGKNKRKASILKKNQNVEKLKTINLLGRERNNFIFQIKRCYRNAIQESSQISSIPIKISVNLNINGSAKLSSIKILNEDRFHNFQDDLKIALLNAQRTLEICSPIRNLPKNKYEIWQEIELIFDSENGLF